MRPASLRDSIARERRAAPMASVVPTARGAGSCARGGHRRAGARHGKRPRAVHDRRGDAGALSRGRRGARRSARTGAHVLRGRAPRGDVPLSLGSSALAGRRPRLLPRRDPRGGAPPWRSRRPAGRAGAACSPRPEGCSRRARAKPAPRCRGPAAAPCSCCGTPGTRAARGRRRADHRGDPGRNRHHEELLPGGDAIAPAARVLAAKRDVRRPRLDILARRWVESVAAEIAVLPPGAPFLGRAPREARRTVDQRRHADT